MKILLEEQREYDGNYIRQEEWQQNKLNKPKGDFLIFYEERYMILEI